VSHFVFTNAYVMLNAVDLSDHVKSVTLDYKGELQDNTAMGATTRTRLGGLKDWSLEIEFFQDFAAAEVDATLFGLVGTPFTIEVKPVNAAASPTNPRYNGTGILESYPPIGGSVGEMAMTSVSIQAAGVLSRAIA
jgi:hypothetical protein